MALSNRNDIRFRYNATGKTYTVLANTLTESSGFKFTSAYGIVTYQLVETTGTLTGVKIGSDGTLTCNEFIEGEPS